MSRCQQAARPIALCLRPRRPLATPPVSTATARFFSHSPSRRDVEPTTPSSSPSAADAQAAADLAHANSKPDVAILSEAEIAEKNAKRELKARWMDPNTTTLAWAEKQLLRDGINPIGSRRRRAAVRQTPNIPFEQLPYHCFQEARQLLATDRAEKLEQVKKAYQRLKNVEAQPAETYRGGEAFKNKSLLSLRRRLEYLKIQADANDPAVKRKFEDGFADMRKPIYRHLAKQRWLEMAYKILVQRVEQFHIVPDILPEFDPKMDVQLAWHRLRVKPGEIVDSLVSETPPNLRVQVFDSEERLVSIVVMDSDVPNTEDDSFGRRLHFMAANVPLNCLTKNISLNLLASKYSDKIAVPWLPPFSQEGAPYHRLSVWIMEQENNKSLNVVRLRRLYAKKRDGFRLLNFRGLQKAKPFGFNMFRSVWDSNTAAVMARHGIPGAEIVFRRERIRSLKPPKKARGWEAKRQGPKYKSLWKYTKNIAKGRSGGT
ncbi:unnamed protein product [Discula destructiva]